MKKIICYLLAAVICLSLLPVSALAVKEQAVKGVGIWDIKLPSVGEFPDTVATALGKGYSIDTDKTLYNSEVVGDYLINNIYYVMNGVSFYYRTGRQWLTFNDTFTYSRTYTAYVYLKADDGYYFDLDALEANIHGVDATIIPDEKQPTKKICVTADFYCDITDVELIMINDVEPPVAGMTPADYKISMAYPEYYTLKTSLIGYVNGIRWVDSAGKTLTAKSKFVEGEVYTVEFAVMSAQKNGKDVSSFSDKISAMINGKYVENGTWDEVYWASSSLVRVYYTLPAAVAAPEVEEDTVIKNVEIGDITAPEAFVAPVYHASVADSELYRVDLENTPYGAMNNGMLWYNSTDSLLFLPTSMVIPGNTYTAAVFLEAKEGYTFDTEALSVTINGRGGDYLFYGDNPRYVCVYADFDVPEKTVYEVEVEMTVPVAGEEVPFYAYTNNNAYYWDSSASSSPSTVK